MNIYAEITALTNFTQLFYKSIAFAMPDSKPVPAPAGGILFFACPKKSIQKKRPPDAASILRSSLLSGVAEKGIQALIGNAPHPCDAPSGLIQLKAPVLGAAYGIFSAYSNC